MKNENKKVYIKKKRAIARFFKILTNYHIIVYLGFHSYS